jgi:hypothetical protein
MMESLFWDGAKSGKRRKKKWHGHEMNKEMACVMAGLNRERGPIDYHTTLNVNKLG